MQFNSLNFLFFFFAAYIAQYFWGNSHKKKLGLILLLNFAFYATWSPKFIPIMLIMGLTDFSIARHIFTLRSEKKTQAKFFIAASVFMNMGLLVFSRYAMPQLGLAAPLGVSYFTFQSISYVVDVYRGHSQPSESLLEFLASLTFFPHLPAGPIIRSAKLLPQFSSSPAHWKLSSDQTRGAILFAAGLLKKALGDHLGESVDVIFNGIGAPDLITGWAGVIGFAAQIYADIAGYSDMAIGVALLLGFQFPINMNLPYLATSPVEYWKRWNITVAFWFRDYVFYPLSTSLLKGRPYLNLFATMTLVGLWHGLSLNCLMTGVFNGIVLVAAQWLVYNWKGARPHRIVQIGITFLVMAFSHSIFRARTPERLFEMTQSLFSTHIALTNLNTLMVSLVVLIFCHALDYSLKQKESWYLRPIPYWVFTTFAIFVALLVGRQVEFIYAWL